MKFFKICLLFAFIFLFSVFCVSCDTQDSSDAVTTVEEETEQTTEENVEPPTYAIVYPKSCNKIVRTAAQDLRSELRDASKELSVSFVNDDQEETEYEILVGNTNREESLSGKDAAGSAGWWVQTVGKKIVINGLTLDAITEAVEYFLANYTVKDGFLEMSEDKNKVQSITNEMIAKNITLRVGSFNIKNGSGVNHKMSVLAEDIKAHNLDIVGLQEVDINSDRSGGIDTLKLLAEAAGYPYYYFTHTINIKGGKYGTAIMSRYPVVKAETVKLPKMSGTESRALGHVVIDVNGVCIDFLNTHLSNESAEARLQQFEFLKEYTKKLDTFILTGDFNTTNLTKYSMIESSVRVNNGKYATYPSSSKAIDEIMAYHYFTVVDSGMDRCDGHSDHNLLWAELHYNGGIQ